jgi:hypothetical protein
MTGTYKRLLLGGLLLGTLGFVACSDGEGGGDDTDATGGTSSTGGVSSTGGAAKTGGAAAKGGATGAVGGATGAVGGATGAVGGATGAVGGATGAVGGATGTGTGTSASALPRNADGSFTFGDGTNNYSGWVYGASPATATITIADTLMCASGTIQAAASWGPMFSWNASKTSGGTIDLSQCTSLTVGLSGTTGNMQLVVKSGSAGAYKALSATGGTVDLTTVTGVTLSAISDFAIQVLPSATAAVSYDYCLTQFTLTCTTPPLGTGGATGAGGATGTGGAGGAGGDTSTTATSGGAGGDTSTTATSGGAGGDTSTTATSGGAGGDTSTTSGTTAPPLQYVVNEATLSVNAGAAYGQTVLTTTPLTVTAGDWLIVDTTIAYTNIGQTYAQVRFTPTGGTASDPMLDQIYKTTTVSSNAYYSVYVVPSDGTISQIAFNNYSYNGSAMVALTSGTAVTFTNLKVVRIAAADKNTLAPALVVADTGTLSVPTATPTSLEWSPTVSTTAATVGQTLVGIYTRGAVATGYASHYIDSGFGWAAVYPSASAQTVRIYKTMTADASTGTMKIGIQGQSPLATDTLTISNVEVRLVPKL